MMTQQLPNGTRVYHVGTAAEARIGGSATIVGHYCADGRVMYRVRIDEKYRRALNDGLAEALWLSGNIRTAMWQPRLTASGVDALLASPQVVHSLWIQDGILWGPGADPDVPEAIASQDTTPADIWARIAEHVRSNPRDLAIIADIAENCLNNETADPQYALEAILDIIRRSR